MKKLALPLLVALPIAALTSCSDDNDLPDVDLSITVSDAVVVDGKIYVVQNSDFTVDGIKVINNEEGKNALITYANYFWDFRPIGQSVTEPFGFTIYVTDETPVGDHVLEITAPVYAVDKSPAFAVLDYTVVVVADESELPSDGVTTVTATPQIKSNDPQK